MKPLVVYVGFAVACLIFFIVNLIRLKNDYLPYVSCIFAILSFMAMIISIHLAVMST